MFNNNRAAAIAELLQQRIANSLPGEKLPGVRELSREFQASAATISAALAELSARGLVRAEPGRGTFVAERRRAAEPDYTWQSQALGPARVDAERASRLGGYGTAEHVPLSWGYLAPELLPSEELQRIGARAAKRARSWAMAPAAGTPELRRVFAAEYRVDPSDVLVVSGGQQALVFAMRTLAEPGETVITESPSYPGAILAAQSAGLAISSVPADRDGIVVERLEDELARTRARVIYLQPSFANPTGAVLSAERRVQVLALAAKYGAFVIEDDWAHYLAIDGGAPAPLLSGDQHGHVVTILTLSKSASPGLRLGALVARGPAGERMRASRTGDELCVAPMMQEIAHDLLTSSVWPRHIARLRRELAQRRDTLIGELRRVAPQLRIPAVPGGGLHLWARMPHGSDTSAVVAAAYAEGILLGNGRHFFVDEPPAPFLRFSFGAATTAQISGGVRKLAHILDTGSDLP